MRQDLYIQGFTHHELTRTLHWPAKAQVLFAPLLSAPFSFYGDQELAIIENNGEFKIEPKSETITYKRNKVHSCTLFIRCAQLNKMKLFGKKHKTESKDFQTFMNDYFTGHSMIRARGEEDATVWNRLKGEELEIAKQKILDELPSDQEYLMRAVSQFRDERAITKLEWTAENGKNEHSRCYAAKILFDWVGYDKYFEKLDQVFKSDSQWSKTSLGFWIKGLKEEDALKYFWTAMNDSDSFVRYSSFGALENYYGVWKFRKDGSEIKYFTDDEVYEDKELFQQRQAELKEKIKNWKNKN